MQEELEASMAANEIPPQNPETQPAPESRKQRAPRNVGRSERAASISLGGLLAYRAYRGLRSGSPLGAGLGVLGLMLAGRGITGRCPVYRATGLDTSQRSLPRTLLLRARGNGEVVLEQRLTVNRPCEKLYERWRRLERLPEIFEHIESVRESADGRHSHWVAGGPLGTRLEWDAEITDDRPGERIAWRSLPDSPVQSEGEVRFEPAPAGRGTELALRIVYRAPAGELLSPVLGRLGNAELREDLRHFKQWIEAGEVPTTEGQPHARKREKRDDQKSRKPRLGEETMRKVRSAPPAAAQESA